MIINGVFYKKSNSLLEVLLNKFVYGRNIYKVNGEILIEGADFAVIKQE